MNFILLIILLVWSAVGLKTMFDLSPPEIKDCITGRCCAFAMLCGPIAFLLWLVVTVLYFFNEDSKKVWGKTGEGISEWLKKK